MNRITKKILLSFIGLFVIGLSFNGTTEATRPLAEIVRENQEVRKRNVEVYRNQLRVLTRLEAARAGRALFLTIDGRPMTIAQRIAYLETRIREITAANLEVEREIERGLRGEIEPVAFREDIEADTASTRAASRMLQEGTLHAIQMLRTL